MEWGANPRELNRILIPEAGANRPWSDGTATGAGLMGQAHIDYALIAASGFLPAPPAVFLGIIFQR